ncbi:hypothetical protein E8E13_001346 [Curvularia kusanoi]|uniref:DUF7924 domain-containing protein n=1 Tax=Curvularia kusanoi TaxID=90978 RepID=A0A9P4T5B4_CURKU|nr:hypothetical protein E8E13_001346 [Curvularia kusanoi]
MSSSRSTRQSLGLSSAATHSTLLTTDTSKTKTTGPYDRQFQQVLIDNGIYPQGYRYSDGRVPPKPDNWDQFGQMLARPRPSLSPSRFGDAEFDDLVQADADAGKEQQVCESVLPYIEGRVADARCRSGGVPFSNLEDLTDRPLTKGKPDVFYGARPEQLDRGVRDALSGHIIPSTQDDLLMLPNFYTEVKGPDGSLAVAGRQACYNGALGARGMHSLHTCGQAESTYDSNAYTITNTYHGGTFKIYTSHIEPPRTAGGRPETYMHQLNGYNLTGNIGNFRAGAAAYRNARDYAKMERDSAILQANERLAQLQAETAADEENVSPALSLVTALDTEETHTLTRDSGTSFDEDGHAARRDRESDSSPDELADYALPAKRPARRSMRQESQRKRRDAESYSSHNRTRSGDAYAA